MKNRYPKGPNVTEEPSAAQCTGDMNIKSYNPIEQMEKEIACLRQDIQQLKFELLDCYRRLDN